MKRGRRKKIVYFGPQPDPKNRYFTLPNQLFSLGLSYGAIAVYAYLLFKEDRETYKCWPSYTSIGEAVNMSKNTVMKYVDELVEHHLIYTEPTTILAEDGEVYNGNLLYMIRPIRDAVDRYNERQLSMSPEERRSQKKRGRKPRSARRMARRIESRVPVLAAESEEHDCLPL